MDLLLGIDDTDILGHKPGTGRLARDLGAQLQAEGLAALTGVVRHQLLVDPRIPYTSHNSPACVILRVETERDNLARRIFEAAAGYVVSRYATGADPGLCLVPRATVAPSIIEFGCRAGSEVLTKAAALELARRHDVMLEELGGTGDGVIGALAAVGLTAEGNGGRFLELTGDLRALGERVPASALRQRGITLLSMSRNGEVVPSDALILAGDWLRPRLIAGKPVLLVEPADGSWRCFDRKQQHPDDGHTEDA